MIPQNFIDLALEYSQNRYPDESLEFDSDLSSQDNKFWLMAVVVDGLFYCLWEIGYYKNEICCELEGEYVCK